MKYNIFILAALAATLVSCSKTEVSPVSVSGSILVLSPTTELTKAPVDGTVFPTTRTMSVNASIHDTGDTLFTDAEFRHSDGVWSGNRYMPMEETVDILAVSHDGLDVTYEHPSVVADSVTLTVLDNSSAQTDILFGSVRDAGYSASGVPVTMQHSQALVMFTAKSNVAYDSAANTGITITGITLKNAYNAGKVTLSATQEDYGYARWFNLSEKKDLSLSMTDYNVPTAFMDITTEGNHFGIGGAGIIVPEQAQTSFVVSFVQHNGRDGSGSAVDVNEEILYPCAGDWSEGKKYNYRIDFDMEDVTVTVDVEPWTTVRKDVEMCKITTNLGPNCFVVSPSASFSFSPKSSDVFWGNCGFENVPSNVIGKSGTWTAEVLWTDFDASKMTITKTSGAGVKDVCTVSFTDASVCGNAVIVIKKGSTVVWSYHLWITDYDPDANAVTFSGDTITWMSRNVGATTDVYETTHCLMYQFGRKDPFPYDAVTSGTAITSVSYNETGTSNYNNMPYSVNNPSVFLKQGTYWTCNDVYNPSVYDASIRWQDPTTKIGGIRAGKKSLFDPCPEGWRTPTTDELNGLVNKGRAYDSSDKGSYVPSKTASPHLFIPSSGYRKSEGSVTGRGTYGFCWSLSSKSLGYGYRLRSLSGVFLVGDIHRSCGFPVRCVKDN